MAVPVSATKKKIICTGLDSVLCREQFDSHAELCVKNVKIIACRGKKAYSFDSTTFIIVYNIHTFIDET